MSGMLLIAGCSSMTVNTRLAAASCRPPRAVEALAVYRASVRAGASGVQRVVVELHPDGRTTELESLPHSETVMEIRVEGARGGKFHDLRARAREEAARCGADALVILGERIGRREQSYSFPVTWKEWKRVPGGRLEIEKTQVVSGTTKYNVPSGYYIGIRYLEQ